MLRERVDDTQRQVESLEGQPQQGDPLKEEQVKELQSQLETLRAKMHRMETLERSFSETKKQLEVRLFSAEFVIHGIISIATTTSMAFSFTQQLVAYQTSSGVQNGGLLCHFAFVNS